MRGVFVVVNHMEVIPDAHSLIKPETERAAYLPVLNKCIEQIVQVNNTTAKTYTIFQVPMFIIGSPLYNKTRCVMFLLEQLVKKNYIAKYIDPNYIHVDWGKRVKLGDNSKAIKKLLEKYPDTKIEFVYK